MKLVDNIKASYDELVNKVTWPTWSELVNSSIVVLTASVLIALLIFIMDLGFKNLMDFIYNLVY
ncbi:preprotein translocase subunit SecE [Saccharicrinis sp. FJH2]|uniref:preprotein translocase subunit SecE n=1 Tax=unclassified Saccharicrinis TaxID=2646859 RepID=UPI0035D4D413